MSHTMCILFCRLNTFSNISFKDTLTVNFRGIGLIECYINEVTEIYYIPFFLARSTLSSLAKFIQYIIGKITYNQERLQVILTADPPIDICRKLP